MWLGLTPSETALMKASMGDASLWPHSFEVGRLIIDPAYRSGPELLKRCLLLALQQLCERTEVHNLFATCSPLLGRLYRRFSFSPLIQDLGCGGSEERFMLVHGQSSNVYGALSGVPATAQHGALAQRCLS
ncbi:MAG: N-acetyltransferase [Burkholderiaceae bacterium]|nr:N-acetyltransferase [Burkholderiaceae bacterium]MDO9089585.1 N-acetyltransferase [Burkholderiaceae bacterium]MDP1967582.1 N-acetyltransferase [Burkholderiaceae bacterium]